MRLAVLDMLAQRGYQVRPAADGDAGPLAPDTGAPVAVAVPDVIISGAHQRRRVPSRAGTRAARV
ncbi:hypothetical protein CF641_37425, partial [Burkholderia pseudomallei]